MEYFKKIICCLIILLALFWTFHNVINYEFVLLDDELHIVKNPLMNKESKIGSPFIFFLKPYQGLYIPITYIFWASLKNFSNPKNEAKVFHLANFLIHSINGLLVFFIICELTHSTGASLIGSLFYSLHPLQVEPVAWISGMKDLLSTMFALFSALLWFYYLKSRKTFLYFFSTLFFIFSLFSKPSTVVLPLILLFLSIVPLRYKWQKLIPILWWIILSITIAVITKILQPNTLIENVPPLWSRFFIAGDAITFYFAKLLLPISLCPDYGRTPQFVLSHPISYIMFFVPLGLCIILCRKSKWWTVTFGVFFISLLPVLGFIPFFFQAFSTVADRFVYFAMLGPAIGIAALSLKFKPIKKAAVATPLIIFLFLMSFKQASYWRNSFSLFEHTLKINPKSLLAHNNLAVLLETKNKWVEAIYHYEEALNIRPDLAAPHYNLGRVYAKLKKYDLSLKHFKKVVTLHPSIPEVQYSVGLIYYIKKNYDKALTHLYHALFIAPKMPQTNRLIGDIYYEKGRFEKALSRYELLLGIKPKDPTLLLKIARCYLEKGSKEIAKNYLISALHIDPKIEVKKFIPEEKLGVVQ